MDPISRKRAIADITIENAVDLLQRAQARTADERAEHAMRRMIDGCLTAFVCNATAGLDFACMLLPPSIVQRLTKAGFTIQEQPVATLEMINHPIITPEDQKLMADGADESRWYRISWPKKESA